MALAFTGSITMASPRRSPFGDQLSEQTKDLFRDFDDVLDELSKIDRHITLEALRAFIYAVVHDGEGLGSTEMAKRKGLAQNVMSRYMLDLGDRARGGGDGLGLVTTTPFPIICGPSLCA
jgi:hypothetical protein